MNNNGIIKKDSDSKKIFAMIIMIATLMVCTTSATYAYFAIAPVSNNTISGTAATAGLTLDVIQKNPSSPGKLVPQKSSAIATALRDYGCIDDNGNTVCLQYMVTVTNTSTAVVVVDGTIQFSGVDNMPNLKWYMYEIHSRLEEIFDDADNEGSSGMPANITTPQTLASNVRLVAPSRVLNANEATYMVVIWLRETGQEQTDSGTFTATITFTSSNGTGVTSTITN